MKKHTEPIFEHNVSEPAFRIVQKSVTANGYTLSNGARHLIVKRESARAISVRIKVYRQPNVPEVNEEIYFQNEGFLTAMGADEGLPSTDAEFAAEMGADVGLRDRFARKGQITNFYYYLGKGAKRQRYWVTLETTPSIRAKAWRFVRAGEPIAK